MGKWIWIRLINLLLVDDDANQYNIVMIITLLGRDPVLHREVYVGLRLRIFNIVHLTSGTLFFFYICMLIYFCTPWHRVGFIWIFLWFDELQKIQINLIDPGTGHCPEDFVDMFLFHDH